jgi:hypothetical protein
MSFATRLMRISAMALVAAAPLCHAGGGGGAGAGGHASASISQVSDLDRAKIDKDSAKRRVEEEEQQDNLDNQDAGLQCGTVSIGNNSNQSGSGRVNPTTTTVIVTGNVYNTASCGH